MPALNFKKQFAEAVENGDKRQTIRATRVHPIKPGDRLYLYTGMRTKACRGLADALCVTADPICITEKYIAIDRRGGRQILTRTEAEKLAIADGFETADAFIDFFRTQHGLPFYGQLITW